MADARGDAGAAAGDVVELQGQGTVTADVSGVHGGAGKLATAADVAGSASSLQKVTASSGPVHPDAPVTPPAVEEQEDDGWGKRSKIDYTFDDPFDPAYGDDKEYEYVSGEDMDVDRGNFASFKEKEEEKIRVKGVDYYYKSRTKTWHCPYCTTKPKPKSGRFVHLLAHAEDMAIHDEDYKIMGQHAALTKVMSPLP
ncbi:hypothetical protein VPH35_119413 [Triticum aestivum]